MISRMLAAMCIAVLGGCAKEVPVQIANKLPPKPAECLRASPDDLPPIPAIDGNTVSTKAAVAHLLKWSRRARGVYRGVASDKRICRHYVRAL